jgi:hypothetical protein
MVNVRKLSDNEITTFSSLLVQHGVSDLKKMPYLSTSGEILALKIHHVLNNKKNINRINRIANVFTKYNYFVDYYILNLNDTIYFVNNNEYYLLNEAWKIKLIDRLKEWAIKYAWGDEWHRTTDIILT